MNQRYDCFFGLTTSIEVNYLLNKILAFLYDLYTFFIRIFIPKPFILYNYEHVQTNR